MHLEDYHVNQRLSQADQRCTVRYIGTVQGKQDTYVGVEWDNPNRGKHRGFHNGIQYFTCASSSSTCASFVKLNTVWDSPCSLVHALQAKYASKERDVALSQADKQNIRVGGRDVQEIGLDKISSQQARLEQLTVVILDQARLQHDGSLASDACLAVRHLDVSRNLYERLQDIADLTDGLAHLRQLYLDGNIFSDFSLSRTSSTLDKITSLSINSMQLDREKLHMLCRHMPSLRQLAASDNFLALPGPCKLPESLEELTIEHNDLVDVVSIANLVQGCPRLTNIKARNNNITAIDTIARADNDVHGGPALLPTSVHTLDLSNNLIDSWTVIDQLAHAAPSLSSLRASGNPLYSNGLAFSNHKVSEAEISMLIIARLSGLETLNLSVITSKDRLEAEPFYLRMVAKQLSQRPVEQEAEILKQNPRYDALCREYGAPAIERQSAQVSDPNSLEARLVNCMIYSKSVVSLITKPAESTTLPTRDSPLVLRLPQSMSIYTVMGQVGKRLGIQPMSLRLTWETGERDPVKRQRVGQFDSIDWSSDSEDDSSTQHTQWIDREVNLVPGTRPLGTIVECKDAWLRLAIVRSDDQIGAT